MAAITYMDFSGGLDRRLPISVQDANKLWTLRNAYVTLGKRLKKRPCLRKRAEGLTGSFGLKAINGRLNVFCDATSGFFPPIEVDSIELGAPSWANGTPLRDVHYADIFNGFPYIVAQYENGAIAHHYVDVTVKTFTITIASPAVVTLTDHGYVAGQEIVFSTTGALPTGLTAGTVYYVLPLTPTPSASSFQVSATPGGPAINTTGTQSGVHTSTTRTPITDPNNPRSISVTKAASRVFAIGGEVVRYCAAGGPRDWTTASDAGFLPVALQQDTKSGCTAVGTFQDSLVVFFSENAQIWNVAVDPSANTISKRNAGAGCEAPLSLASFANDLMFLSPYGFRSMTVQAVNSRIDDADVGVPIDTLVQPDVDFTGNLTDGNQIFGGWIHQLGQYWAVFDMETYSKAWVYTYSKSSKLACWSEYIFPIKIEAITTLAGKVYLRSEDVLYDVVDDSTSDDGALVNVEIQMAFQDAKSPGVAKQVYGADLVVAGSPDLSYKYDPRDLGKESIPQRITGDTRPGDIVPVEIQCPAIAPVFRHALDEAFELDALTLYYNPLGTL